MTFSINVNGKTVDLMKLGAIWEEKKLHFERGLHDGGKSMEIVWGTFYFILFYLKKSRFIWSFFQCSGKGEILWNQFLISTNKVYSLCCIWIGTNREWKSQRNVAASQKESFKELRRNVKIKCLLQKNATKKCFLTNFHGFTSVVPPLS